MPSEFWGWEDEHAADPPQSDRCLGRGCRHDNSGSPSPRGLLSGTLCDTAKVEASTMDWVTA